MRWIQFSVAGLLVLVTFVGVACAALVHATPLWSSLVATATVAALFAAAIAALFCQGRTATFCAGFAIVGWGYFLLTTLPWLANVKAQLATTAALAQLQDVVEKASAETVAENGDGGAYAVQLSGNAARLEAVEYWMLASSAIPRPASARFFGIGHALWSLVCGAVGGAFACFCARKQRGQSQRR